MVKHTPGPWTLIPASGERLAHVMGADHARVTTIDDCHIEPEAEANAALIAAAPDLLDGAEGVLEANKDLCFCEDTKGRGLGECVWCELRAAIAKAKGGGR